MKSKGLCRILEEKKEEEGYEQEGRSLMIRQRGYEQRDSGGGVAVTRQPQLHRKDGVWSAVHRSGACERGWDA